MLTSVNKRMKSNLLKMYTQYLNKYSYAIQHYFVSDIDLYILQIISAIVIAKPSKNIYWVFLLNLFSHDIYKQLNLEILNIFSNLEESNWHNMKECKSCLKTKDTNQFSKSKARKDGLQDRCKDCNKKDNLKFRTEINPEHHADWQRNNWDKFNGYMKKYKRADKLGTIYGIVNPLGETYVGMTQSYFTVRKMGHMTHYRRMLKGKRKRLGSLHNSFDKYGIDTHRWVKFVEIDADRQTLHNIEKTFIKGFMQENKSLNTRKW